MNRRNFLAAAGVLAGYELVRPIRRIWALGAPPECARLLTIELPPGLGTDLRIEATPWVPIQRVGPRTFKALAPTLGIAGQCVVFNESVYRNHPDLPPSYQVQVDTVGPVRTFNVPITLVDCP